MLVIFIVVGAVTAILMSDRVSLPQRANLTKPPDALIERARDLLRKVGYTATAVDSASGFYVDGDALRYVTDTLPDRPNAVEAAGVVGYLYRESPQPLLGVGPVGGVDPDNPTMEFPGEVSVQLDGQGRLRTLRAVPPRIESDTVASPIDWSVLFSEAGLDIAQWKAVDPEWTPPFYADTRNAWTGNLPYSGSDPVRIEAASYRGKPVSFAIIGPWTLPTPARGLYAGVELPTQAYALTAVLFLVLGSAAVFFARRNLRLGRGDRRGATRLMLVALGLWTLSWICIEHHVASLSEWLLIAAFVGTFLPAVGLLWSFTSRLSRSRGDDGLRCSSRGAASSRETGEIRWSVETS